ncbi:gamma-secretase subunit Aph-1b-like [Dysidea avara]|uniref:gamma-secretase subunit Aph-1b-like n=1 Tax=Dysidea avara TaxID=196820 RepID=UPI0033179DFF
MSIIDELGYLFIAFGPSLSLFFFTVARNPHEVIVMIVGAFFWNLSLFFASIIRVIVPPLKDEPAWSVPFAVMFQELFRYAFYKLLIKADDMLALISEDTSELRKHKLAYVAGMGFGVASGAIMFSNVLKSAAGPGTVGIFGDSNYFILQSAFGASIFVLLHICWGVLFFDAVRNKDWIKLVIALSSHMLASSLTLLNSWYSPVYSLVFCAILLVLLAIYSLHTAGANFKKLHYVLIPFIKTS